ncbi:PA2778 family cysteine peptidase [Haliea atlantica]
MLPQPPNTARAIELASVPFFPQADYQCGPAALATVLVHTGIDTDAETLVPQVYLPGREGSLQPELRAAARRAGRIPWPLEGGIEALFSELNAGNPVLVLQNLGVSALPVWHYAVVIGYQPETRRVILRSGREKRREEPWGRFLASWNRAGMWGLVVLPPDQLPASYTGPDALARALASQESSLPVPLATETWDSALERWPKASAPLFGSANALYASGRHREAAARYRALLQEHPDHLSARNNFADLLLREDCPVAASSVIEPALAAQASAPLLSLIRQTAAEIKQAGTRDAPHCGSLAGTF